MVEELTSRDRLFESLADDEPLLSPVDGFDFGLTSAG